MKKAEREIKNFEDIIDVLRRCDTVRVGLHGEEYPYVVPLSFGFEVLDGKAVIYVHGAKEGLKHDLIAKDNRVCVEADILHRYLKVGRGITADYESVIGFGRAEKADRNDSVRGIDLLLKHCGVEDYSAEKCVALGATVVYKITLDSITGKKRVW